MLLLKLLLASLLLCQTVHSKGVAYFWKKKKMIELEQQVIVGSTMPLFDKEEQLNKILLTYKGAEFQAGLETPEAFLPSMHFFNSKPLIEESKVFQLIKQFPKGASLHSHDIAMVSEEFLLNLTYTDNLYACIQPNSQSIHRLRLQFFKEPDETCDWRPIEELRIDDPNFDDFIREQLSLVVPEPCLTYPGKSAVWGTLIDIFITLGPFLTYRPIWYVYFYQAFQELYDDNVMYIEFRTTLPNLYDLDGTIYSPIETASVILQALKDFKRDNPDFLGGRIIYAPLRSVDNTTAQTYVSTTLDLKKKFPEFFAGFDLVGWEDKGQPLEAFVAQLEYMKKFGVKFFFHAGDTNFYGTSVDFNLFDAVLLGAHRIGGAQAIIKHPEILKIVKMKNIGIELTPISSQVLKLQSDYRNDAGNYLIANDFSVVVGNDDPGVWGAKGLSYDWYLTYMGMTSMETDLKFLKKLALNSIEKSAMPFKEKLIATKMWYKKFEVFVGGILAANAANIG